MAPSRHNQSTMPKSKKDDHKKKKRRSDGTKDHEVVDDVDAENTVLNEDDASDYADDDQEDAEQSDDQESDGDGIITDKPFSSFGIHPSLLSSIASLKWSTATQIQAASLPSALEGRDVIGLAETGR